MSFKEIEGLSKADLKNKLSQMGMSLDRDDHPRDYYAQLYLEKSNAKNKITRDNTPFYNNKILPRKRERESIKETEKELIDDPNYEEEEYEEEEEILDEGENFINEELEEKNEEEKGNYLSKRINRKKMKIEEKDNDYKESGIKIIRLIRKKKEKNQKTKNNLLNCKIQKSNVRRRILNNLNEMVGQNDEYENNNSENYLLSENTQNQNINISQDYDSKNNEFYKIKNMSNFPEINNDVISLKVEKINNYEENKNNNKDINLNQNLKEVIKPKNNIISFGDPKDCIKMNIHNFLNGPISFGANRSSVIDDNRNENMSESIKEDIVKDNQNSSKSKKIIIKWDTLRQKEFLYSSMEKEQTFKRPSEKEMNNLIKTHLQSEFETKDNEKKFNSQQRDQIVSDSIHNTIISQNAKNNNNMNINENQNYKSKIKIYTENNGIKINNSNDLNPNNAHKYHNSNDDINTNKENIYTKEIIKDINNNINEKKYNFMSNLNDNINDKFNKEFISNNNQENNYENMNIIDDNNNNDNCYYKKDMEIRDKNDIKYLSNNDNNMNNDNNIYAKNVEMKYNLDMNNLINGEANNNELNNKKNISEQEFEDTKKTKNCLIF